MPDFYADRPEAAKMLKRFGKRIAELRVERGWSQRKMAELCQMHRITLLRIEGGKHSPLLIDAVRMADILGAKLGELIE
ncbi:helix-turn-helix transcriptional regulator [Planctomicrobium piriforme]|uniref:DNA-binding transcriptional regulator, XRE-family HTH domain n=1 Tax=Planctomicrobium piriforme TaxID=1576369 RepID=A0A1I3EBJ9_9PLAN|nr:helix-turn-helix transcriptional regulator [Planctomicrobium piriforme]SFH96071.1 DNA-binding transcriptional regulator, XRE-family HTH domain [Planctomicrobium piriforme]